MREHHGMRMCEAESRFLRHPCIMRRCEHVQERVHMCVLQHRSARDLIAKAQLFQQNGDLERSTQCSVLSACPHARTCECTHARSTLKPLGVPAR